jgi:molybdenum-dependent DNA-binding transcriptional regulator ModE
LFIRISAALRDFMLTAMPMPKQTYQNYWTLDMLDIRQLKTLAAIKETGSLAEAAERLHLTQSALSHQLKDLENLLDLPLLIRKTRPPRFTKAGERLLAFSR